MSQRAPSATTTLSVKQQFLLNELLNWGGVGGHVLMACLHLAGHCLKSFHTKEEWVSIVLKVLRSSLYHEFL